VDFTRMQMETDVTGVLGSIRIPTLVLHRVRYRGPAHFVAERISGAETVEIGDDSSGPYADDAADALLSFLRGESRPVVPDAVLATMLLTDLAGSTDLVATLGDRAWREVLAEHHQDVRRELVRYRGVEVDSARDGFFCRFDGRRAGRGVRNGHGQGPRRRLRRRFRRSRGARAQGSARIVAPLLGGTFNTMRDAFIVDAVRSPIGRRGGSLAGVRADELAAQVLNGLVGRLDVDPGEVEDVQMGCVTQVGEQALNVGRQAVLVAGWSETVCASTVDRQCGSSLQAAFNGASAIQAGHLDVVVAAGVEHMTRVPMGSNLGDAGWGAVNEKIGERWPIVPQGISAEVLAEEWGLTREQLDEYSLESHRRAVAAIDDGRFENEIVPIEVDAAGAVVLFAVDETPRADTSLEKMASLQPAFKADGVVTAGNSSSIVDGSAAMLLVSGDAAERLDLDPHARFVSFGLSGVDPYRMLHGNPEACAKALAKAGLTWDDIAVIEVNEAFASVVLQFLGDTGLHGRWEAGDVNPNGGGISLGHPLGATGARITATLLSELDRREARYGIATMCIGQGQAIAGVVERL